MNAGDDEEEVRPIRFPCLMKDYDIGVVIFANAYGVGMVLDRGASYTLHVGDVIPYGQSRFVSEQLDFIPMPDGSEFILRNLNI